MCSKIGYSTKTDACDFIRQLIFMGRGKKDRNRLRGSKDIKKMSPYECYHCGKWHITSKKRHKFSVKAVRERKLR